MTLYMHTMWLLKQAMSLAAACRCDHDEFVNAVTEDVRLTTIVACPLFSLNSALFKVEWISKGIIWTLLPGTSCNEAKRALYIFEDRNLNNDLIAWWWFLWVCHLKSLIIRLYYSLCYIWMLRSYSSLPSSKTTKSSRKVEAQ